MAERQQGNRRRRVRRKAGKKPTTSSAALDAPSVKTSALRKGGVRLNYAAKNTLGRKRFLIVDTLGLILGVVVTVADHART
ncbi:MAG: hypothetical protein AAGG38_01745 [Planctomycetota bacterium]